jgi:hypothetical protein
MVVYYTELTDTKNNNMFLQLLNGGLITGRVGSFSIQVIERFTEHWFLPHLKEMAGEQLTTAN